MSDPYRDAFARDYIGSKDFARMYGVDKPVRLRLFAFGLKEAKDPTNYSAPAVPKPFVWFVEHQDTGMFVNNTQHEYLLDRFGDEYWLLANRPRILHAPVMCKAWTKKGGDGLLHIVSWSGDNYDQWKPIGEEAAERFRELVKDLRFTRERFRHFVLDCYPEVSEILDSTEKIGELPDLFKPLLEEFRRYLMADRTPDDARPAPPPQDPKPEPKPDPAKPRHADPSPEPNFNPTTAGKKGEYDITEDDIPF